MQLNDINRYVEGVLNRNRQVLAKTITLIESSLPEHQEAGHEIVNRLLPHTGKSIRLGITGIPGAGKSTFIESFGLELIGNGLSVAVLAVDPSSTRSGGSILADKTRMERLSASEKAFIRPSPSSGTLGGVARKTRETMLVCEAAGFDVVIVETVGVGQSEISVSSMVDFFLVLIIAGAGDEIQGIKKGLLEHADLIAINKADGDNIEKAEKARKEYESAIHLMLPASRSWVTPVMSCSAIESTGIKEIWDVVKNHRDILTDTGEFKDKRRDQSIQWMRNIIDNRLMEWFYNSPGVKSLLPELINDVENGMLEPTIAASKLLLFLEDKGSG